MLMNVHRLLLRLNRNYISKIVVSYVMYYITLHISGNILYFLMTFYF